MWLILNAHKELGHFKHVIMPIVQEQNAQLLSVELHILHQLVFYLSIVPKNNSLAYVHGPYYYIGSSQSTSR